MVFSCILIFLDQLTLMTLFQKKKLTLMTPTFASRSGPYARTLVSYVYAEKERMLEN